MRDAETGTPRLRGFSRPDLSRFAARRSRATSPARSTGPAKTRLIVADLHLEKGSAFAARGQMLPPYDTRETLRQARGAHRSLSARNRHRARRQPARSRCAPPAWIRAISKPCTSCRRIATGSGSPATTIPKSIERSPATSSPNIDVDGIALRHEPRPGAATHEIAGHLHPAARLVLNGTSLRRPCFVGNGLRLVMPAFGAYTGGLNILDAAFEPLFGDDGLPVWMLGHEGLYPVAPRLLRDD